MSLRIVFFLLCFVFISLELCCDLVGKFYFLLFCNILNRFVTYWFVQFRYVFFSLLMWYFALCFVSFCFVSFYYFILLYVSCWLIIFILYAVMFWLDLVLLRVPMDAMCLSLVLFFSCIVTFRVQLFCVNISRYN